MSGRPLTLVMLTSIFMAFSCGGSGNEAEADLQSVPDTLDIAVSDTIGVLMGDSAYVFGKITDASHTMDGGIYILDGIRSRLGAYSGSGRFLGSAGRPGSGPGEYQYPKSFALLSDGSMAVCDWGGISVTYLTPDLEFDTLLTGYRHIAPDRIVPCPEGSFIGMTLEYGIEDDEPVGETQLARFDRNTEPQFIYCAFPMRFSVDEDGDLNVHTVNMTWDTGPDGSLFMARRNDSTWSFTGYGMDGDTIMTVSRQWERVPKSQEELEEGLVHETLSTSTETGNTVNRDRMMEGFPRFRNAISSVDVDDLGRIWIGQGWTDVPTFEVYGQSGEMLFVARIPELEKVRSLSYCFDNGYLAWDDEPVDYPKVYLLEIPDSM
mgnify:FL=1